MCYRGDTNSTNCVLFHVCVHRSAIFQCFVYACRPVTAETNIFTYLDGCSSAGATDGSGAGAIGVVYGLGVVI